MKKPTRLLLHRKTLALLLLLAASALYITRNVHNFREFGEFENEEEESEAEALGPIDYWGSIRSFPNTNGEISAAKYAEAWEHMKRMPEIKNKVSAQSRVQASNWVPLGPMNFSGRILCLGFHPTNANIIFAGSAGGGLWKTTTGGTGAAGGINWTQVPIGSPVMSVPAIAINPSNANEMYIGTGEVYNTGTNTGFPGQNIRTFRGSYGIGILKSTNGGTTWFSSLAFTNSSIKGVQKILIDPTTPANVFAATSDGVYRSTNSGGSWTLIHSVVLAMDLSFAPGNPDILYVTCGDFNSAGSGIYKSTNARAASPSFSQLNVAGSGLPTSANINGMTRISITPNNANIIYASVGKIPGSAGGVAAPGAGATCGLYKSTDAGATWAATAQPSISGNHYLQNQGWYAHDVLAGPTTVNNVFVSEIDLTRSTNGGGSFTQMTDWSDWDFAQKAIDPTREGTTNIYVHADHHRLYFGPFDATYQTVYVVTDGGVFRSTDNGTTWKGLNGGLMTAQIYHKMGMSATNSNLMICGLQDNATLWYQGTTGCKRTTGGDGFYSIIDPSNDSICLGTYSYLTYYRSTTGIRNLGGAAIFSNPASATTSLPGENAAFVAPLVMAPSDRMRVYGGTINFKRSTTNGASIANVGPAPVVNASAPIIYIGVSKTFADSVYIATCPGGAATGRVYISSNGGTSWTQRTGILPNRYYTSMAIDPNDSKRVAITLAGFGTSHIYLTTDAGVNWVDIGGSGATSLPDIPANVVMFDPTTPSTIYVGNDLGVFVAQNVTNGAAATTWYTYNSGLIDATNVMDLQVAPNGKLRMGSYGKGLWENNMVTGSLPVAFESFQVSSNNNGNLLTWVVSAQNNVSHYEIEYSTDATNFATVGSVAARTGSTRLTYNFLHKISNSKNGYYRIKVVDKDGEVTYSAIEEVKAQNQNLVAKLVTYPNPTSGIFKVKIPASVKGTFYLKIYDEAGKMVMSKAMQLPQGVTETELNLTRFATGNYQLVCTDDQSRFVTSILKR